MFFFVFTNMRGIDNILLRYFIVTEKIESTMKIPGEDLKAEAAG